MNWTESVWTLLTGAAWKSTFVLAGAWLLAIALRNRSAAVRHIVWTTALAALLLLPLLAALAPPLTIPIAYQFQSTAQAATAEASNTPATATPILIAIWAAVAAILLLRFAAANLHLAAIVRRAKPTGSALESNEVASPMAWGLLRPAILVPVNWNDWSPEARRRATLHEQAHIHRHDCATLALARITTALYWFHPLAWLAAARLRDESEHACDDAVLNATTAPADYADQLIQLARLAGNSPNAAVAMVRPSQLERRVRAILHNHLDRRAVGRKTVGAALATLLAIAAPLAMLQAQQEQQEEPYKIGGGVTPPVPIKKPEPQYDPSAKEEKVEGTVVMEIVISSKGTVTSATVVKSLDSRLDIKAIEAITKWEFKPGMLDGKPVAVKARVEMNFRLL